MKKPKIGVLSLGCPRTLVDSEAILSRLHLKGYNITEIADSDIALVNTCAFIKEAKEESIEAILDLINLKKEGKIRKILVYGCLVQRYKEKLKKYLPEVDAFVGCISLNHNSQRFPLTPSHYAYLKICEGCINNCSYCIIPKIKTRFVSLDIKNILKKVEELDGRHLSELNIIGQDITAYGIDLYNKPTLVPLLKEILKKTKNIHWMRLLYLNPLRINSELISLIKDNPQIVRYIDIPIQHINERILKLMNRKITPKEIFRTIYKIREKLKDVALRTSIIVGFPTEKEKEFQELINFIKEIKFERLGAFIYSREEGTLAYKFKGQIPYKTKLMRFNTLMFVQREIAREVNNRFLNTIQEVIIDEELKDEQEGKFLYLGRTQYDAPEVDGLVYVYSSIKLNPGQFI
ncbi:MAG: MiaB/RimO family radical SAM methylthiotransferase, partial [Candidatus Omnitrophica bacterium]|nr:MiaB/RimO family radical SAM methylthiotransferase [Candidatus Omnitrophota bacterium]